MSFLSLLARLTAHSSSSGHTILHFLDLSFSASIPLRYPSTITTLNTFVPLTQWGMSYLPLFVGKTHRVTSHLVHLAADLAALHLLAYSRGSKIGIGVTQPCSRNQPLDQGSTTGPNLGVESALCTLS